MKSIIESTLAEAYQDGRELAAIETHIWIDDFPEDCPWTLDQVLDQDFWEAK